MNSPERIDILRTVHVLTDLLADSYEANMSDEEQGRQAKIVEKLGIAFEGASGLEAMSALLRTVAKSSGQTIDNIDDAQAARDASATIEVEDDIMPSCDLDDDDHRDLIASAHPLLSVITRSYEGRFGGDDDEISAIELLGRKLSEILAADNDPETALPVLVALTNVCIVECLHREEDKLEAELQRGPQA